MLRPRPAKSCVDCVRVDVRAAVPSSVRPLEHGAASGTGPKPCACLEWSVPADRGGDQKEKKKQKNTARNTDRKYIPVHSQRAITAQGTGASKRLRRMSSQ